ncbi:MAG: 23S rRNA (adenine(2503)-C(2))-methyltransferase RlmN [Lachnospiraceae bacterium]|nr:23S rRNA (adenine(2503)-C(2))-methyltransferase RlmN [Lachnospiraceae bacterium]
MTDIKSMTIEELQAYVGSLGEPAYRAGQIFKRLHRDKVRSFDEMTELPKALRERLRKDCVLPAFSVETMQESRIDGTRKYLFRLDDGNCIESVLMHYHHGDSVCVSTQVGCRMGCRFCASTIGGLIRNLTPAEILEEVYSIERDTAEPVTHIVLMGSGEPFDNYENVVRFLRLVTDPNGRNLSARHLTVSTSGIPDRIRAFAREGLPVTLALSLHASDDETRRKLMPIARKYPLSEVLSACEDYFEQTGRRVTYEYAVVRDVNDSAEEALKLARLLKGKNAHVNLIPVNPVRERSLKRPDAAKVSEFQKNLEKSGINATIRRELGTDIDGACGQLRAKAARSEEDRQSS